MIKNIFLMVFLFNMPISGMNIGNHTYGKKYNERKRVCNTDSSDDERDSVGEEGLQEPLFVKILADKKLNKNKQVSPPSSEMTGRRITKALLNKEAIDFERWKKEDIAHRIYDKKAIEIMVNTFLMRKNNENTEVREQNVKKAKKIALSYWKERRNGKITPTHEESLESLKCLKFALKAQQRIMRNSLDKYEYHNNPELNELIFVKCTIYALIRLKLQSLANDKS